MTTTNEAAKPTRVAALQMVSAPDVEDNLVAAARLVAAAAERGCEIALLPEYFCILGRRDTDKVAVREADPDGPVADDAAPEAGPIRRA